MDLFSSSEKTSPDRSSEYWFSESPEVFYSRDDLVTLGPQQIERLKKQASINPRRRARLCAHAGKDDSLHEMLIVHHRDVYVRPHLHVGRTESLHVLEGDAELNLFHPDGRLWKVVPVGRAEDGRTPYCRIPAETYHSLSFNSEWFVFHEVIAGPFDPSRTIFAPWAPEDGDSAVTFLMELRARTAGM